MPLRIILICGAALMELRHLVQDHPEVGRSILVCLERKTRRTDDGIEILPARAFVERLRAGDLSGQGR